MKSSDIPSGGIQKKYAIRFMVGQKTDTMYRIWRNDPGASIDNEGNEVTAWIKTRLTLHDLETTPGVEHVVEAN